MYVIRMTWFDVGNLIVVRMAMFSVVQDTGQQKVKGQVNVCSISTLEYSFIYQAQYNSYYQMRCSCSILN